MGEGELFLAGFMRRGRELNAVRAGWSTRPLELQRVHGLELFLKSEITLTRFGNAKNAKAVSPAIRRTKWKLCPRSNESRKPAATSPHRKTSSLTFRSQSTSY